jgi:RNA polymerase sigma factor (sigma-70 family)
MRSTDRIEQLAARAARGDGVGLEELLRLIRPEVLRDCGRYLPYPEDAEEAAQDTLLQVSRNIGRFEGRSKFTSWLYPIVANSCRLKYRELRRRAVERGFAESDPEPIDPRTTSVIAGSRVDLLEVLERLDREHSVLVAPLVYRDIGELEYADIAEILGVPIGTIRSRLHEARSLARRWLAGNDR